MEYTLTEQLLLILAREADRVQIARSITLTIRDMGGDPSVRKNYNEVFQYIEKKHENRKLRNSFYSLIRNGYLQKSISGGATICELTNKGQHKLAILMNRKNNKTKKQLQKGSFLLVFFDIPERLRTHRDRFREYLRALGFEKWQKSIWICSYDVRKELRKYIFTFEMNTYIEVLVVKKLKWD